MVDSEQDLRAQIAELTRRVGVYKIRYLSAVDTLAGLLPLLKRCSAHEGDDYDSAVSQVQGMLRDWGFL